MSQFINFANQLKVIRDINTTTFYQKTNGNSDQRLEVRIESGDIILFDLDDNTTLETLDYSKITAPTSSDIQDLVNQLHSFVVSIGVGVQNTIFFRAGNRVTNRGDFAVQTVAANGQGYFLFQIPTDFASFVSLKLLGIPTAGAAGVSKDIDLLSDYAFLDEAYNNNSESDTSSTYDLTGTTDKITDIDISGVFTGVEPGHFCGLQVKHNAIGGTIDYIGIELVYNRS